MAVQNSGARLSGFEPFSSCVTLGKWHNLSGPQFASLETGDSNRTSLLEMSCGRNEWIPVQSFQQLLCIAMQLKD